MSLHPNVVAYHKTSYQFGSIEEGSKELAISAPGTSTKVEFLAVRLDDNPRMIKILSKVRAISIAAKQSVAVDLL